MGRVLGGGTGRSGSAHGAGSGEGWDDDLGVVAEQRGDLGMEPRPTTLTPGDDGCVVVADPLLGNPAEPGETDGQGGQEVGHRQPEGEHGSVVPECGRLATRPNASRLWPLATGTAMPVCHQSSWTISPGRYDVR
jgi:hypothetical protein